MTNVSHPAEFITAASLYSVMIPKQEGLRERRMHIQYQTATRLFITKQVSMSKKIISIIRNRT